MSSISQLSILVKDSLNGATIKSYSTKNLVATGENYGSVILAVDIILDEHEKEREKHLVAKLCPTSEFFRMMFNIGVTFKKEVVMYETIVPTLQAFQQRQNPSCPPFNSFAKCYGSRYSLNPEMNEKKVVDNDCCLLLENVKVLGYVTADRMEGFNLDCSQFLVKDLAKLHATPIALKLLEPELFQKIIRDNISVPNFTRTTLPEEEAVKYINESITRIEYLAKYKPHIPKIKQMMLESYVKFYEPETDVVEPYASLVHSDFWTNNTMIKKNAEGKCVANCFLDFQLLMYGNPFADLMFFLYTSAQIPVLKHHFDELIDLYFDTFVGVLKELQVEEHDLKHFTKNSYLKEIDRCMNRLEMYHCIFMLAPIFAKKENETEKCAMDLSFMHDRSRMDSEKYYPRLEFLLNDFVKRGWLKL